MRKFHRETISFPHHQTPILPSTFELRVTISLSVYADKGALFVSAKERRDVLNSITMVLRLYEAVAEPVDSFNHPVHTAGVHPVLPTGRFFPSDNTCSRSYKRVLSNIFS